MLRFNTIISLLLYIATTTIAQNVGIGTNTPNASAKLEIQSTDSGILIPRISIPNLLAAAPVTTPAVSLLVYNTNATTGLGYYYWDGTQWVKLLDQVSIDHDWYEVGTTTPPDNINDDIFTQGSVGIGTTTPNSLLHLYGGSMGGAINYDLVIERFGNSLPGRGVGLEFRTGTAGTTTQTSARISTTRTNSGNGTSLLFATTDDAGISNTNMSIIDNGNVGIGTTAPNASLDIRTVSGGIPSLRVTNTATNLPYITFSSSGTSAFIQYIGSAGALRLRAPDNLYFETGTNGAAPMILDTDNNLGITSGSATTPRFAKFFVSGDINNTYDSVFVVQNDATVGIGTTAPTQRLDVNGQARVRQINQGTAATDTILVADTDGVIKKKDANSLGLVAQDSTEWRDAGNYIIARDAEAAGNTVAVTDNGRIGVGTTSPLFNIQATVAGTGNIGLVDATAPSSRISIGEGTSAAGQFFPLFFGRPVGTNNFTGLYSQIDPANDVASSLPAMIFAARVEGGPPTDIINRNLFHWRNNFTDLMVMDSDGYLGIGVDNPAFNLDVDTTINTGGHYNQFGLTLLTTKPNNSNGNNNTAVGHGSMVNNITGGNNTTVGFRTLNANTSGINNTAIGGLSLNDNTTGNSNTALGYASLVNNTTGNNNTGMGVNALSSNSTGFNNVATGSISLRNNTTGSRNTATGNQSLFSNIDGNENTALGYRALEANTTANNNVGIGTNALFRGTTGSNNVGLGYYALSDNTTGSDNIAIGHRAGNSLSTGNKNIIIGSSITFPNTTGNNQLNIGNMIYGIDIDGTNNTISSGRIGIGKQTPTAKFHVYNQFAGPVSDTSVYSEYFPQSSQGITHYLATGTSLLNTATNYGFKADFTANTAGTRYGIYIDGETRNYFSSRVGIATTSPSTLLQVGDVGGAKNTIRDGATIVDADGPVLRLRANGSNEYFIHVPDITSSNRLYFNQANLATTTTLALVDDRVGINTTAPTVGQLQVRQSADNSNAGIAVTNAASTTGLRLWVDANNKGRIDASATGVADLVLNTGGGNVGVGITTPGANLHVASGGNGLGEYTAKFTSSPSVNGAGGIVFTNTEAASATGYKWHTANTGGGAGLYANNQFTLSNITVASGVVNQDNLLNIRGDGRMGWGLTANTASFVRTSTGATLSNGGAWTNSSDRRLKTNIVNSKYGLATILSLRPVDYTMIKSEEKQVGFIAQEVQEIVPEAVYGEEGDLEKNETLSLSYDQLVPVLTKAIQEQQQMIEKQNQAIKELQKELQQLKDK